MGKPLNDLTGQTIGNWKVLKRIKNSNYGHTRYLCQCLLCKRKFPVRAYHLRNRTSTKCMWCATGKIDLDVSKLRELWKTKTQREIAALLGCSKQLVQRKLSEEVECCK